MHLSVVWGMPRAVRAVGALLAAGVVAMMALFAGLGSRSPDALAFTHDAWSLHSCSNISTASNQHRFWDDAPGAGVDDESVFISANANDTDAESCTWWNNSIGVQATSLLGFAAVNDGAVVTVTAFGSVTCGGTVIADLAFPGGGASNAFRSAADTDFGPTTIQTICITLAEASASSRQRISALVRELQLLDGTTAVWSETFGRNG